MTSKFWHKLRRINWDEDTYRDVVMSVGDDSVFLREPLHLYEFEISETGEFPVNPTISSFFVIKVRRIGVTANE